MAERQPLTYTDLKLETAEAVATLRLNRPAALNALSPALLEQFADAVAAVGREESVKALVIRGEGRAFCAGADLLFFNTVFAEPSRLPPYVKLLNDCLFQLEALPIPTIAVAHGYTLAGGLELLLACDLALAATDARLGDQHANFGLIPGGGATWRLPRRLGMQRAMELLTTGRHLSGTEAAEWGLVLRAAPPELLDMELEALLSQLRNKSRAGLERIKSVTQQGWDLPKREGITLESENFIQHFATSPHPQEGIQGFKEKRQPEF